MALRLRVLVKMVMVVAIILWAWHLASDKFRGEEEEEIQKERDRKMNTYTEDANSDKHMDNPFHPFTRSPAGVHDIRLIGPPGSEMLAARKASRWSTCVE